MIIPQWLKDIPPHQPILITGPTACGKSKLAIKIAAAKGGVITNADALQVFKNWRILTARPTNEQEKHAPHELYGHIDGNEPYSVGRWLTEVTPIIKHTQRPIIVGGTGLYFTALTEGLADIPNPVDEIRLASKIKLQEHGLNSLINDLDKATRSQIDLKNPVRVLRAWQVWSQTGHSILDWQKRTPDPILSLKNCTPILLHREKSQLNNRIEQRVRKMLDLGVLEEIRENIPDWYKNSPSFKAIGAYQLTAHLQGKISIEEAINLMIVATRQFAKRQRTWFRKNMKNWRILEL